MRSLKTALFLSATLFSFNAFADDNNITLNNFNLDTAKKELIQYHDSGKYMNDIAQIDKQAEVYLQQRVNQNTKLTHTQKLAIVFDIDETSLSNYPDMSKLSFGGTNNMIVTNLAKADDPAIQPTLELYRLAKKDKLAVFFITGRGADLTNATIKNLQNTGYTQWNDLYLRPENYHKPSIIPFKSSVRKEIEHQGYDVIIDIGDQQSDLNGGFADKDFKLPNPYYYIP